mmetsp:Transcript_6950/g.12645  ORF Transcript_6950/g.12645 Transcript_6950/m.12645 type:complete len:399 (+) Transcript_6950:666-1862(+)
MQGCEMPSDHTFTQEMLRAGTDAQVLLDELASRVLRLLDKGHLLSEISEACRLTDNQVLNVIVRIAGLSKETVKLVVKLKEKGLPVRRISRMTGVGLKTLRHLISDQPTPFNKKQKLISDISNDRANDASDEVLNNDDFSNFPKFVHGYAFHSGTLIRTRLSTGVKSTVKCSSLNFVYWSVPCEVPKGQLYFSGGSNGELMNAVTSIDLLRDFASFKQRPMLHARVFHGVVYYKGFLYVVGGEVNYQTFRRECERLSLENGQWEEIQPLPTQAGHLSLMVLESTQSLYSFGGQKESGLIDLIQRLCLVNLTWEVLPVKLPISTSGSPCFKVDEFEVCLIVSEALLIFNPFNNSIEVQGPVQEPKGVFNQCYYRDETLHYANVFGNLYSQRLGPLNIKQ